MKELWQLRDQDFGLCLIEPDSAGAAMREFLPIKVAAALKPDDYKIAEFGDGTASVLFRGAEYRDYRAEPA